VATHEDDGQQGDEDGAEQEGLEDGERVGVVGVGDGAVHPDDGGAGEQGPGGFDRSRSLVKVERALGRAAGEDDEAQPAQRDEQPVTA